MVWQEAEITVEELVTGKQFRQVFRSRPRAGRVFRACGGLYSIVSVGMVGKIPVYIEAIQMKGSEEDEKVFV